jgi:hypothetical protein
MPELVWAVLVVVVMSGVPTAYLLWNLHRLWKQSRQ